MNHFDGIAALPEKMAEVAVRADFFTDSFAKFHKSSRIVDHEVGMHLEGQALDAMFARVLGGFLPVRDNLFLPLPVQHFSELGGPAISCPVWHNVRRRTAGTPGEAHDDFDVEHFREKNGLAKGVDIFLRALGDGMNGITVATERSDADASAFKFFLPSFGFRAIRDELVEWTVMIVRVAAGTDFHGFKPECRNFVEHFVDTEF